MRLKRITDQPAKPIPQMKDMTIPKAVLQPKTGTPDASWASQTYTPCNLPLNPIAKDFLSTSKCKK